MAGSKQKKSDTERGEVREFCGLPPTSERVFDDGIDPFRLSLIRYLEKKWVNGTVLRYYFFKNPANWRGGQNQEDAVRSAFQEWKDLGIGLKFREVQHPEEAEVRIGFERGAGSWSYVGRDAVDSDEGSDPKKRTMNFGWDVTTPYGGDTALHEIGHALGFPHEHQNPNAGILWNTQRVIEEFSGPPNNWNEQKIQWNILRKINQSLIEGSDWDPDSIMHYQFRSGLIDRPEKYQTENLIPAPGLSDVDIEKIRDFYPKMEDEGLPELRPFESQTLQLEPSEQANFLIEPKLSREYTVQTFGRLDTVLVLFEEIDGENHYLDGDDDSGTDFNAKLTVRLLRGRRYVVRIRLYFGSSPGQAALMLW